MSKEWRELLASRAFWVMLFVTGPLVGVSFISAVNTYAELSDSPSGVGEAFSPLVGIWAPTFSAYEIVAAFLLPFVAIRMVSGDRMSGALKLETQQPISGIVRMAIKSSVLFGGWLMASIAAVATLVLWRVYGGAIYWPEIASVVLGHFLNAGLTIGLASAAASLAEHPATAAILTLGFTVGTWVISFVAAVRGGWWERAAGYTPPVMVAAFQRGLVGLDAILIALALMGTGLVIAAVWMRIGASPTQRAIESFAVIGVAALCVFFCSFVRAYWDASENRYNSFSVADEEKLKRIRGPLTVEVHLAPEDPRRYDLDRNAISKLRRAMSDLTVHYVSATSTGIFEQTSDHYGEIWYHLAGHRAVSRETTAEGVLENVFEVAALGPPEESGAIFRGHPLVARPVAAASFFYILWPSLVLGAAFLVLRRQT